MPILSARLAASTITRGTATTISGAVTPVFAGAQVNIYRCPTKTLTGCRLATTTRTSSTGAYRAPVKASLTSGRVLWVRARLVASSSHAEDWSAPLSLRAR